jgi:hypothetical protein
MPPLLSKAQVNFAPMARLLEPIVIAAAFVVALLTRFVDLDAARGGFPDLFDEGIRAQQLFLMSKGFRPYRDIYAAQGPLLLDSLYPFYSLLGETLGAIRAGIGVWSMLGLAGIYLVGREAAGRWAGIIALVLLTVSPSYTEGSRLALAEVPSMTPLIVGLWLALRYLRHGARWLILVAALCGGVGLLVKPMAVAAIVPIAIAVLVRGWRVGGPMRAFTDSMLCVVTVGSLTALVVMAMGPRDVFEQLVVYRAGATGASAWESRASWKEAIQGPIAAQPLIFAGIAVSAMAIRSIPSALPLAWLLASFTLLFLYTPLHPKHLVYLAPPSALAFGVGVVGALDWQSSRRFPLVRRTLATAAVGCLVATLAFAPQAVARATMPVLDENDLDLNVFDAEAAAALAALTRPDQFVLTDHPYIAFLARRMVPPELVDPSRGRARAGTLTDEVAIRAAVERDTPVVMLWADRLKRLGRFNAWVERGFTPVASFGTRVAKSRRGKDRTIYLRNDQDFAAAKTALFTGSVERTATLFGDDLRVSGATLDTDSVRRGEPFAITMAVEALRDITFNYKLIINLTARDGRVFAAQEQDLEGTVDGSEGWRSGGWMLRSFMLVPEPSTRTGDYTVQFRIDHPRTGQALPMFDARGVPVEPGRVVVGTLAVVP